MQIRRRIRRWWDNRPTPVRDVVVEWAVKGAALCIITGFVTAVLIKLVGG